MDMTASYAVFANGGKKATPYASSEIRNSQGKRSSATIATRRSRRCFSPMW